MTNVEGATLYCARFLLPITALPVEGGALLVDKGQITAVGPYRELTVSFPNAKVVDFGDAVLLPPMVNAHTHLELSSFPDWAAEAGEPVVPKNFVDWILWLVRVRRSVTEEKLRSALVDGLQTSLDAGTGAIGDIFTTLACVSAYQHSPMRGRVFAEVLGHDSKLVAERLEVIESLVQNPPGQFLDWGLSPHAPYTLSSHTMGQVFDSAEQQDLQCGIHFAESIEETHLLQSGTGSIADKLYSTANWPVPAESNPDNSPAQDFSRLKRLRAGDLLVHGVHVDAADVDLIKDAGCAVALCPRSNAALNVGKAPLNTYLKAGVTLSLGTDSRASSSSLSIWDEVAFARDWFSGQATPREWLEMATLGGARALGLQDRFGHLSVGCEASFQVVTVPEPPCVEDLEEALCSYGPNVKVTHLYLGGCLV